ncbi:MAG: hypothetical protein ACFFG0_48200 [Candidatus Thorarchaeota archaeon]
MKKQAKYGKLLIIKQLCRRRAYPDGLENQTSSPIPNNVSLGTYEDQILPFIVTEYFIKKAGTILLMDYPYRTASRCKNHDIKLGCTSLGK